MNLPNHRVYETDTAASVMLPIVYGIIALASILLSLGCTA